MIWECVVADMLLVMFCWCWDVVSGTVLLVARCC